MKTKKPTLIVIAGPNGSGKTSLTHQLLKHDWVTGSTYINPDQIAQEKFGNWNSAKAVLKAVKYAENLRKKCLKENKSFIFETVFSSSEKVLFIEKAQKAGYFIRLFFVGTDHPSINAARVTQRVLEGGHDVPITKIIDRYSKSISNCTIVASMVDRLYVYDNSVDLAPAKLLFRASKGRLEKTYYEINTWATSIYKAVLRK